MKLVISDPKTGRAYQKELSEEEASVFYTKKIGDEVDISSIGFPGYVVKISGGTDKDGFPMRPDVHGSGRKRILAGKSVGIRTVKYKGEKRRKTVRGNTVAEDIAQLNVVVVKYGKKSLEEIIGGSSGDSEAG